jgi:hypothetical protein
MASMCVLNKMEITGKGGYRGVCMSRIDESESKKFTAETAREALMRNFPDETKQILGKLG